MGLYSKTGALFKIDGVFFKHEESNVITKILIDVLVVCDRRRQTKLSEQ